MRQLVIICGLLFFIGQQVDAQWLPEDIQKKADEYNRLWKQNDHDISALKGTGAMPFFRYKKYIEERIMADDQKPLQTYFQMAEASMANKIQLRNAPNADWKSIGPDQMVIYGGRTASHAFHPTNKDIVFVGSATGGLWKTEDGGQTWHSKTDMIPSTGVGGIAVNPQNGDDVIIGTGEGYFIGTTVRPGLGIFISSDGGDSWRPTSFQFPVSQGVSVLKMDWDPIDPNNVYAAATNGLWVSRDGGQNWYVKLANGIADDVVINPQDPNIIYCIIENDGIYKSTNKGENWNRLDQDLPATGVINFGRLAICDAAPNVLYASLTDAATLGLEGLYKTIDGGDSWTRLNSAPNAFCPPPPFNYGCQGWYDNTVGVSPFDPDLVLFGGITFWRSDNGGVRWTQHDVYGQSRRAPPGKTFVDHHDIGFSPHDENLIYSFNDGGVAISTNRGMTFNHSVKGMLTAQFYSINSSIINPNILTGGMQDHGLQATNLDQFSDKKWIKWGDLDGTYTAISHLNPDIFYGGWIDGQYLKTINGTGSWQTVFINGGINPNENIIGYFNPLVMNPEHHLQLVTATPQQIYRTTNGGYWEPKARIPNVQQMAYDQVNSRLIYAASFSLSNGTWNFYRSEDNGNNWRPTATSPGWRVTDLVAHPHQEGTIFATRNSAFVGNPHVFKSTDKGDSWISLQGDLPDITVNDLAINHYNPNILYVGTDLGVYVTLDGGVHWTPYNEGMPVSICYSIHYNPTDTSLIVGTIGRSAWKTKSDPGHLTSVDQSLPGSQLTAFPNPSSDPVNLSLTRVKPGVYHFEMYDINGRYLGGRHHDIGEEFHSSDLFHWMGLGMGSGTYFLRIRHQQYSWNHKIIRL